MRAASAAMARLQSFRMATLPQHLRSRESLRERCQTRRKIQPKTVLSAGTHTPRTILKSKEQVFAQTSVLDIKGYDPKNPYSIAPDEDLVTVAAEEQASYQTIPQVEKAVGKIKKEMDMSYSSFIVLIVLSFLPLILLISCHEQSICSCQKIKR